MNRTEATGSRSDRISASLRKFAPLGLALVLIGLVGVKAFVDFDAAWDSIAYHQPFAALRAGIMDAAHYQLTGTVKYYFEGFPVLGDYVKGWLWRIFGRPEATNLVSVLSFLCLATYVWRAFRIPFAWVTLGLAAIPVVQVSLTHNYLDLPANSFMTVFVLSLCDGFSKPLGFGPWKAGVAVLAAALAAHLKAQLVVQVALVIAAGAVATLILIRRRDAEVCGALSKLRWVPTLLFGGGAILLIFSEALYHWYRLGNPFYPLALDVGPFHLFDGPLVPWGLWPEPVYSAHYPQPFRWLLSVLEYRAFDSRVIPYTIGNGDVPLGAMSMRVGGFMGLSVLFSLGMLVIALRARRDRTARTVTIALALASIFACFPPGSHEIRYGMYWMMLLVLGTFILLSDPNGVLNRELRIYKMFLLSTLLYVVTITGGEHVLPRFRNVAYFERVYHVREKLEEVVLPGSTICLKKSPQLTFLYSPIFQPALAASRPYSVRSEGFSAGEKDFNSKGSTVCTWVSP